MIVRTRAWRRRNTRRVFAKVKASRDWLVSKFEDKAKKEARPHRPGKLTRAQALRQWWSTNQELREGLVESPPGPVT